MKKKSINTLSIFLLLGIISSCNQSSRIKERIIGMYAVTVIEINGERQKSIMDNSLFLKEDDICSVPRLYDDRYKSLENYKTKWDIEVNGETTYLIISGTRFEGKYELSYDLKSGKIALQSKNISIWATRVL